MAKSKHTKEEIEQAYELYKELKSLTKVSEKTGINRKTLADNFDKYGFKYEKRKVKEDLCLLNEHEVLQMYEIYKDGASTIALSEKFGIGITTIHRAFKKYGLPLRNNKENSRKYHVKHENYFRVIDTDEKAYWLGFIYADGYVSIRKCGQKLFGIALSSVDEEILIKLNDCLGSNYPINRYKTKESKDYKSVEYSRLLITSETLVDDLINNGAVEHKTNILKPPSIKYELVRHFIRGYLDGDGTIGKVRSEYGYDYYVGFIGTEDILQYISNYLLNEGLIYKINKFEKRKANQIVSSVKYGGNIQAQRILDHLYNGASLWLARKYNVYKDLIEYNSRSHK